MAHQKGLETSPVKYVQQAMTLRALASESNESTLPKAPEPTESWQQQDLNQDSQGRLLPDALWQQTLSFGSL